MNKQNKKEPEKIIIFMISVVFISFLWIKNDILAIFNLMSKENALPLILTCIFVSVLKIAIIAGTISAAKWLVKLTKNKKGEN